MTLKRIQVHLSTLKTRLLFNELSALGITEIKATQNDQPVSQLWRYEFLCETGKVDDVLRAFHRSVGVSNSLIGVSDFIENENGKNGRKTGH